MVLREGASVELQISSIQETSGGESPFVSSSQAISSEFQGEGSSEPKSCLACLSSGRTRSQRKH